MTSVDKAPRTKASLIERAAARVGHANAAVESVNAGTVHVAAVSEALGTAPPLSPGAPSSRRHSREVAVDLRRLRAHRFIVPNGERTRTAEEFRIIKRRLLNGLFENGTTPNTNKPRNVIMVTSARPGEGKTFTALNLAISMALERDLHVLLIDCDFTQPKVLSILGLKAEVGLADVLRDDSLDLADVILKTDISALSLIPPGSPHKLAPEMLSSRRMQTVAEQIATRYSDRIIIYDSPPLLATAEPAVLVRYAGQIVVVIEADKTSRTTLQAALDVIGPGADVRLVLNKVRFRFGSEDFGSYYRTYS